MTRADPPKRRILELLSFVATAGASALAGDPPAPSLYPDMPAGQPPPVEIEDAEAADASSMRPYREIIPGTDVSFEMAPIPGGRFTLGSPPDEPYRGDDEDPVEVEVSPFWMGVHEVTWDEYLVFMSRLDIVRREDGAAAPQDAWADAVSRPTPPYRPMDFEMGTEGCPAICMTQFAARHYTKWLSMKTGRFYRLPTEAEWEFACRAGTSTAYSFGDDPEDLPNHGWFFDNSEDRYHPVGRLEPNAFGLYDMHGNVAEWVLDRYSPDGYPFEPGARDPIAWPTTLYPRVVRGGSWDDDPDRLRSAARRGSSEDWKQQDPQLPKSIWYHTDATFVGFRVVRPLTPPPVDERGRYWDPDTDEVRRILERQRTGAR